MIKHLYQINPDTGQIVSTLTVFDVPTSLYPNHVEGEVPNGATHYRNGTFLTKPDAPSPDYDWNDLQFVWRPNLVTARVNAKVRINAARNLSELNGFAAYGKTFDSDPVSVQRISIGVQSANAVGESFSINWTCADNSVITLDYSQMIALPVFMANAANQLHIKARDLKDQIDAAQSLEEINNISW